MAKDTRKSRAEAEREAAVASATGAEPAPSDPAQPARQRWYAHPFLVAVVTCLATAAAYWPIKSTPADNALIGGDFQFIHARRMEFARREIAEHGRLPAWYPRELMGTPFWANVQNFPFIPTRLVLHALPPLKAYTAGVILGAVLAALFTFQFARAIGLSPWAAAACGWTFACAGYYASRVLFGALPLLEAYAALPLLLWLVEINARPTGTRWPRLALAGLALAAFCVAMAGHPQLPFYAFVTAGLYLFVRGWAGWRNWRRPVATATAMALGVGCAGFVLLPMFQLIGRSTRSLLLEHEVNSVALPFERLAAFVMPWKDGRIDGAAGFKGGQNFPQYPDDAYVLDTVNYIGLLPLAAAVFVVGWTVARRKRPTRPAAFLAIAALVALVTALPPFHPSPGEISITFLRAPSRQTYVTTFALAMALGAAIDVLRRRYRRRRRRAVAVSVAIALLLAAHGFDLTRHTRPYIRTYHAPDEAASAPVEAALKQAVGDGRIAIDFNLGAPFNRRIDDVGFFESILLAKPYLTLAALERQSPTVNTQALNGSALGNRTLATAGVRIVMSPAPRPDLAPAGKAGDIPLYAVRDAVPRALFLPASAAVSLPPDEMRQRMRDGRFNPHIQVMLPPGTAPAASAQSATSPPAPPAPPAVEYRRPSSDEIALNVRCDQPGYVRVVESFDPGWQVEVDGRPADVLAAEDTFLCVAVPPGDSRVTFTYSTPGAGAGIATSLASLALLVGLLTLEARDARRRLARPPSRPRGHPVAAHQGR